MTSPLWRPPRTSAEAAASGELAMMHPRFTLARPYYVRFKPCWFGLSAATGACFPFFFWPKQLGANNTASCGAQTGCSDSLDLAAGDNEVIVWENIYSQFKIN